MDGIHDLGGRQGHGPIDVQEGPAPFHFPWEARLFGITRAFTEPVWTSLEMFRVARECIEPAEYLDRRYYDQWLLAHEVMLVDTGVATVEELSSGRSQHAIEGMPAPMSAEDVAVAKFRQVRFDRPSDDRPAFTLGDTVRIRSRGTPGHTRLPQYVRGCLGTIERFHGFHIFPDSNVMGDGFAAPLYNVSFRSADLWDEAAGLTDHVHLDLWEPYLERA